MCIDKSKMAIRKAAVGDTKQMKAIAKEVGRRNYVPFLGAQNVNEYLNSGLLEKDIDEHLANTVVCEYEADIVGMCAFWDDLLHVLLVKHVYQRCGIGKALLDFAEVQMFADHDVIRLETFENNASAIAFYEKNGWKAVGTRYSEYISGNYALLEKRREEEA